MPTVSAAASWVDTFKIPLREIRKRYTVSDLTLLGWDSRLKSYNMRKGMSKSATPSNGAENGGNSHGVVETENSYALPSEVNNGVHIPKKFFNEEGEVDLRKVTGDEAVRYVRALGINIVPAIGMR